MPVPAKEQSGAPLVGQGAVALVPLSPLQPGQVALGTSPTSVGLSQSAELEQPPQVCVLVLQSGVLVGQSEFCRQPTQVPWLGPLSPHSVERHTVAALPAVQGPVPLAKPHLSSFTSQ